jgi:hypothetical protein
MATTVCIFKLQFFDCAETSADAITDSDCV